MAIELTTATTQQLSGIRQSLNVNHMTVANLLPEATFSYDAGSNFSLPGSAGTIIDFTNAGSCTRFNFDLPNPFFISNVSILKGGFALKNLKNAGTAPAIKLRMVNNLSKEALEQFFTDLPTTNQTATIDVAGAPGAATCDPTIATAKGYTVVTS